MKEFIEKLIGRLEQQIFSAELHDYGWEGQTVHNLLVLGDVRDIANQLAEEYKQKEYCWQSCASTEHCKECSRLGNGDIDYFESIDSWMEEYKETPTIDAGELMGKTEEVENK